MSSIERKRFDLQPADETKLKELIVYATLLVEEQRHERFGTTKLNKILWFSDVLSYGRHGRSITGHEYQKNYFGPTVRRFVPILQELQDDGSLAVRRQDVFDFAEDRPIALRPADLSVFRGVEIDIVRGVVDRLRDESASSVSAISHRYAAWQLVDFGDTIPMELLLFSFRDLSEQELQHARRLESEIA